MGGSDGAPLAPLTPRSASSGWGVPRGAGGCRGVPEGRGMPARRCCTSLTSHMRCRAASPGGDARDAAAPPPPAATAAAPPRSAAGRGREAAGAPRAPPRTAAPGQLERPQRWGCSAGSLCSQTSVHC